MCFSSYKPIKTDEHWTGTAYAIYMFFFLHVKKRIKKFVKRCLCIMKFKWKWHPNFAAKAKNITKQPHFSYVSVLDGNKSGGSRIIARNAPLNSYCYHSCRSSASLFHDSYDISDFVYTFSVNCCWRFCLFDKCIQDIYDTGEYMAVELKLDGLLHSHANRTYECPSRLSIQFIWRPII